MLISYIQSIMMIILEVICCKIFFESFAEKRSKNNYRNYSIILGIVVCEYVIASLFYDKFILKQILAIVAVAVFILQTVRQHGVCLTYRSGQGKPNNWANFSQWIDPQNTIGVYSMPLPIFKAAESYFLLAEAKLRWDIGSASVQSLYEDGIRVSMTNELSYRGKYAGVDAYAAGAVDEYINGTTTQVDFEDPVDPKLNTPAVNKLCVKWDEGASNEEKLERIITQKYFALFPLSIEAWAEQRRTGYPHLFPAYVDESNGGVNKEEGVRRVIYSSNAYDTNAQGVAMGRELLNKENSSKNGISGDKGGTHLWWDNANKGNF